MLGLFNNIINNFASKNKITIFKNNLIVTYVGDLSNRTRAHFEKVSSALKERGIIVVNIPENWEEL